MGNLINNKNQLNKFNIGFEFEFNVLKKSLIKEEKIPPEVLKKYGHLISLKNLENYKKAGNYFLKKINEAYPETNWNECFVMTAESNLGAKKTHIPVEMIFKHEIGSDAIEKLKKIIIVLNSPDFLTNDKCGHKIFKCYIILIIYWLFINFIKIKTICNYFFNNNF